MGNIWPATLVRDRFATAPTSDELTAARAAAVAAIGTDHDVVVLYDDRGTDTVSIVFAKEHDGGWSRHRTFDRREYASDEDFPVYTAGGLGELMLAWSMTGMVPLRQADAVRATKQDMKQLRRGGVAVIEGKYSDSITLVVREHSIWRGVWDEFRSLYEIEQESKRRSILWQAPAGRTPKPVPAPKDLVDVLAETDRAIDKVSERLRFVQTEISELARQAVHDIVADRYINARSAIVHRDGEGIYVRVLGADGVLISEGPVYPTGDTAALHRYISLIADHYTFPKTRSPLQVQGRMPKNDGTAGWWS
jgi:hypothetical protein